MYGIIDLGRYFLALQNQNPEFYVNNMYSSSSIIISNITLQKISNGL